MSSTNCLDTKFDQIMKEIGFNGKFQTRFYIIFNVFLIMAGALPYSNIILSLAVPDHWCHVPGRIDSNYSINEWKHLTIPIENDAKGTESFSKCKMYIINDTNHHYHRLLSSNDSGTKLDVTECQFGWEFDRTWYKETAPTEGNWVCDKELHVANAFAFAKVGDVIGTFIFGQLGDIIGRKPVFYMAIIILSIGRFVTAFSVHNYTLFLFSLVFGNLTCATISQAPLIIAMEISDEKRRAQISMMQFIAGTISFSLSPFLFWALGHWFYFMMITTVPFVIFLFSNRFIVESPRWLAGQGKIKRCVKELQKISHVNGTTVPDEVYVLLRNRKEHKENVYGIMSLFSNCRLAKNTVLILVTSIGGALIFYVVILNVNSLAGNPFLNFFYLGIVQLPTHIVAKYFCDTIGRRWTQVVPYLLSTVGFIAIVFLLTDNEKQYSITILYVAIKVMMAFIVNASCLQILEIYPTCLRQTGISLATIIANAAAIFGPYIVYLGTSYDARYPPLILAMFCFAGTICTAFLPETLNAELPETLSDACNFGTGQKFWSLPRQKVEINQNDQ